MKEADPATSVNTREAGLERGVRMTGSGVRLAAIDSAPQMHLRRLPLALAAVLLAAPAVAQSPSPRPETYTPVAVTLPAPLPDPDFAAFRAAIAAAAKSRLYADLEALVQPQGFFWDRDFGNGFDPRKPPVDNLAVAIELEHRTGAGWERLAKFAGESSIAPLEARPGVLCAPAKPGYDALEFSKLLDTTTTTGIDWAYPVADATPVRATPRADARAAGRLGLHFVRLLGFEDADSAAGSPRDPWARVVLPDGKVGFVAPGSLSSLTMERLCYIKDMVAGWRITGYVGGGN